MKSTCIFCKILVGVIPSTKVYESDSVIAIKNINPVAPVHYLVLPKKHIENMGALEGNDFEVIAELAKAVKQLSSELPAPQAFNVIVNNGSEAGQSVFHLHWHFVSGKNLYQNGLAL